MKSILLIELPSRPFVSVEHVRITIVITFKEALHNLIAWILFLNNKNVTKENTTNELKVTGFGTRDEY